MLSYSLRCFVTNQVVWVIFCIFLIKRNYDLKAKAVGLSCRRASPKTNRQISLKYLFPAQIFWDLDAGTERTSRASSELQQEEGQGYDAEKHQHVDEEEHPPAAGQPVGQRSPAH